MTQREVDRIKLERGHAEEQLNVITFKNKQTRNLIEHRDDIDESNSKFQEELDKTRGENIKMNK